jgi:hypothetical protein
MSEIPKLDREGLRDFGLLTGTIIVGLFGLLIPILRRHSLPVLPWAIAIPLWFLALAFPMSLTHVYQIWMRIGLVLGWINTRIILALIFYLVVLPSGILMRLFQGDPLRRKFERKLETYRVISNQRQHEHMERPF